MTDEEVQHRIDMMMMEETVRFLRDHKEYELANNLVCVLLANDQR